MLLFFLSLLIVAFGQPSISFWIGTLASLFGYALFWQYVSHYSSTKERFWRATFWYTCVTLIQLSWMTAIDYQGYYILLVWLLYSAGVGAQFGALTLLIPKQKQLTALRILAIASAWTLLEWSRYFVLSGYSWNLSGMALSNLYAIQWASVFGVLGLSFWVLFVNLLFLKAYFQKKLYTYLIAIAVALVPYFYGFIQIERQQKCMDKKGDTFSCLLVQPGMLPDQKIPLRNRHLNYISSYDQWKNILYCLKEHAREKIDLIVLPESAVCFDSETETYDIKLAAWVITQAFGPDAKQFLPKKEKISNLDWSKAIAALFDCEVVVGLDHFDEGISHASAFHLSSREEKINRYDKRVLMPLAEYLPIKWLLPLVKYYGVAGFFTPGTEAKVFHGRIPLSISICYEETFPHVVREGRKNGAEILVNVTNDGWYPYSRLTSQHLEHARFRSVENGCPLLRACNTGITVGVDSLGRTVDKLVEFQENGRVHAGALHLQMNTHGYKTLFLLWGNWGILIISSVFLGLFILQQLQISLRKSYPLR